jgi:hypothetical protein
LGSGLALTVFRADRTPTARLLRIDPQSGASVGKVREAVTFLKIAKLKVPPTDTEYVEKIDKNLAIQSGDGK